jgi:hypothetical protein
VLPAIATTTAGTHLAEHMDATRLMPRQYEDLLIGFPPPAGSDSSASSP